MSPVRAGRAQPELLTPRLLLRPLTLEDAPAVAEMAADRDIALNTLNIPHPYGLQDAQEWIVAHAAQFERRESATFGVVLREADGLIGSVGLILDPGNDLAELGYWIGRPYWGRGYATEAGRALVEWGFATLDLHRVHASHFPRNPASGRVLEKIGMRQEGRLREHVKKWGEHLDLVRFGILRREL